MADVALVRTLAKYLANLGYGSRREVEWLIAHGRITGPDGSSATSALALSQGRIPHADLRVDGEPLDPPPGSVIALHKPVGYVCSTTDTNNRVIYELLPSRFRDRKPIMASVGRLDRDTSGLLLITDDGQLNHRLTAPRHHVPKAYLATLAESLRGDEATQFLSGTLMLDGDDAPAVARAFEPLTPHSARITLDEGRYHQVRRMFAAVGHHVTELHRESIGGLSLSAPPLDGLSVGTWCVLPPHTHSLFDAK